MSEMGTEVLEQLYAYQDGELRGLARWRFERRLQRSPALRTELERLARLGSLVRESERAVPGPELWDRIAQRLPAIDALREEGRAEESVAWGWLRPAGGLAAAVGLGVAVWLGTFETAEPEGRVVRWVNSGGRPVMVLEADAESDVTIIWMLDDAVEGAAQGGGREVV